MRFPRPRLAVRIYLAGLAQVAAVVLGFALLMRIRASTEEAREREARVAVDEVAAQLGDAEALAGELDRVQRTLDATIVIYDDDGRVLATNRQPGDASPGHPRFPRPPGPPGEHDRGAFPPHRPPRPPRGLFPLPGDRPLPAYMIPVQLPDGGVGRAVFAAKNRRSPSQDGIPIIAMVLVVVGVASLLTARSLARPLARLSSAARAFGAGKRDARVALSRSDEIGDVALAFDEMADRVESLLRAEKELLANVSHELRTPLARIRVALDLASEGNADVVRESLGEIAEDLAELDRLIGDVLTAARLDLSGGPASGDLPLRREPVDLREILERAAARFRSAHPQRTLVVELEADLPSVDGDPVLLRRVVDNLLENAHKYSDGATRVDLRATGTQQEARLEVQDYGIGIAPEDLSQVFRPFFRADRSRARATGGLGLGLALARRIVEAHQGTIALDSKVGEGTCARVQLPATRVAEQDA